MKFKQLLPLLDGKLIIGYGGGIIKNPSFDDLAKYREKEVTLVWSSSVYGGLVVELVDGGDDDAR